VIVVKTYCQQGINFTENPFVYCQSIVPKTNTNPDGLKSPEGVKINYPYTCYSNDSQTINILTGGSLGKGILGYPTSTSLATVSGVLPSNAVILSYPIAVECPSQYPSITDRCNVTSSMTYGVGTLNIMVWQ
jgi:hypothetical protein